MVNKKRKYKLIKTEKKVIAIGISLTLITSVAITNLIHKVSTNNVSNSNYTYNYTDSDSTYFSVKISNEKEYSKGNKSHTNIEISQEDYNNVIKSLNSENYDFSFSNYYDLKPVLELYNNYTYNKKENYDLITNGLLDSNKLYNVVKKNNENYMKQEKNNINSFLSLASDEEIKNICDMISKTYNDNKNEYGSLTKISDTLINLKIFRNETSSSNAYVTDNDLTLVFNPNMMKLFANMQEMRGNTNDGVIVDQAVFLHEIEHLFQKNSNDFDDENGIETGFCRKYNNANVNSLWYSWLLDGAAEIKMANTLNTTPKTYDKKISYIRSYNLSRIFDKNYNTDSLVNSTFSENLNEAFATLKIYDDVDKINFLELMFSIEITQNDVEDFWNYYEKSKNLTLTSEEKNNIRMTIRTEVVKSLSKQYYSGLVASLLNNEIKDIETLFYLMRLWELDCCGHLDYTNKVAFNQSEDFILWQEKVEQEIFEAISYNNNISYETIEEMYNNYKMTIQVDNNIVENADFSNFDFDKQKYIKDCYEKYSVSHFARISTMVDFIRENIDSKEDISYSQK